MDNFYNQFSELFCDRLNPMECQWTEEMMSLGDAEAERLLPGVDLEYGWPGFECSIYRDIPSDNPRLWIRSGKSFCPENVAAFVRAFLRKFRPSEVVKFSWAGVCSEPQAGGFGGGWAVISARKIVYGNTWDAATDALKRMKKGMGVRR
jgi:hypothetical protein